MVGAAGQSSSEVLIQHGLDAARYVSAFRLLQRALHMENPYCSCRRFNGLQLPIIIETCCGCCDYGQLRPVRRLSSTATVR